MVVQKIWLISRFIEFTCELKNLTEMQLAITVFTARRYAKRGICRHRMSVRLCVCVSVTLRYCIKTAEHRIMQIMPHDSPVTI